MHTQKKRAAMKLMVWDATDETRMKKKIAVALTSSCYMNWFKGWNIKFFILLLIFFCACFASAVTAKAVGYKLIATRICKNIHFSSSVRPDDPKIPSDFIAVRN